MKLSLLQIKKILAQSYGCSPTILERKIITTFVRNSYGEVGSVLFSLEGSPPKGYALYVPEHRKIIFLNAWLEKIRTISDFERAGDFCGD